MKLYLNRMLLLAVLLSPDLFGQGFGEVEGLRVPLEVWPDGTVKTEVTARKARVGDSGALIASGLKVEFRKEDGTVETRLEADACEFDRAKKTAKSDSAVVVTRRGLKISGTGFEWVSADQKIVIKNNVEVTFEKDLLGFNFSVLR